MKKTLHLALVFLLLAPIALRAAIPAGAKWSLNASATANNVNGGFFNTGATFAKADFTATSATGNSPVIASATYTFVAADDEAWIYVSAGTNWVSGRTCRIDSVAGGEATLSAAIGACVDYDTATRVYTISTTAGIATTASPTAGTLGINYSFTTAAPFTNTDLATADGSVAGCVVTSATTVFAENHIGNGIRINEAGTGAGFFLNWYSIVSVSGSSATLDKACGNAGASAAGDSSIGGALSMNSTLDDDVLELAVAGNDWLVKDGSYTFGEAISITASGGTANPVRIIGYQTVPGDLTFINCGGLQTVCPDFTATTTNTTTFGSGWNILNSQWLVGSAAGVSMGTNGRLRNVKVKNNIATINQVAVTLAADGLMFASEAIAYRGRAVNCTGSCTVQGSWLHASNTGIRSATVGDPVTFLDNLISHVFNVGINIAAASTARTMISGNAVVAGGATTKLASCVNVVSGATDVTLYNNNIAYCTTGVAHADTQTVGNDDFNNYFGNTADVSAAGQWQKGANDTATNPAFTSLGQVVLTSATTATAGDTLVKAGADLSGVVAGRDYVNISAGTGVTTGIYGILSVDDGTDTIVLDLDPGANAADVTADIQTGHNFLPTVTLSGYPGAYAGAYTTGYRAMGIQRATTITGGGGGIIGQ